jgi:uncharacterized protein
MPITGQLSGKSEAWEHAPVEARDAEIWSPSLESGQGCERIAVMAFLYRLQPPRPSFAQDMNDAEAEVMERHVAYWQDLLGQGTALAFGPVLDPGDPWGLGLLDLDDEPAARAIGEADPAVIGAICTYEVVPIELVQSR